MTAAKITDIIARLPGCDSWCSICFFSGNIGGCSRLLNIPESECPDVRLRLPRHKWQNSAPVWNKLMKDVDIEEPTSFLDHIYLGCTQRECKPNEKIIEQYNKMFESRISAGATEKRKPRVHAKSRSEHQKSTQTQRKPLGNTDQRWEDAYFDMDAIYGFIDVGSIAYGPELRKRMYFPQTFRVHCIAWRTSNKVDKKQECTSIRTPYHAWENSTVQKM